MTTPDYILRFAEAIAPGNAELLLTGSTEEAILNAATDTMSDLRERNAELEAQEADLLAACKAALELFTEQIRITCGCGFAVPENDDDVMRQLRAAIARANGCER